MMLLFSNKIFYFLIYINFSNFSSCQLVHGDASVSKLTIDCGAERNFDIKKKTFSWTARGMLGRYLHSCVVVMQLFKIKRVSENAAKSSFCQTVT
jgi:hypothetical protein